MACRIDGCDNDVRVLSVQLCAMHYKRYRRGTLDKPRYQRPRGVVGTATEWPFEFIKMGDDWFRRPSDSNDEWSPVVWPERGEDYAEPRPRGYL